MRSNWCAEAGADVDECGNWLCYCGHFRHEHFFSWNNLKIKDYKKYVCTGKPRYCTCYKFRFLNNDGCEIECLFRKKLEEVQ